MDVPNPNEGAVLIIYFIECAYGPGIFSDFFIYLFSVPNLFEGTSYIVNFYSYAPGPGILSLLEGAVLGRIL